jgi:hypothetical protein
MKGYLNKQRSESVSWRSKWMSNEKYQITNSKWQITSKKQVPTDLYLEHWYFGFIWNLLFVFWNLLLFIYSFAYLLIWILALLLSNFWHFHVTIIFCDMDFSIWIRDSGQARMTGKVLMAQNMRIWWGSAYLSCEFLTTLSRLVVHVIPVILSIPF